MTIDECVNKYLEGHSLVLTEQDIRNVINMLLAGETITNTAKKLKLKTANVTNVRNVFENKCGLYFPNAKRVYKKFDYKLSKTKLNSEKDILVLIEENQAVTNRELKTYISDVLNISFEKAGKLYRKYMNEYCRFKGSFEDKKEVEIKLNKYIANSRHSRQTIMEVAKRIEAGDIRKEIMKDLNLSKNELQAIVYRLKELSVISKDKEKIGRPTKYEGEMLNA